MQIVKLLKVKWKFLIKSGKLILCELKTACRNDNYLLLSAKVVDILCFQKKNEEYLPNRKTREFSLYKFSTNRHMF